MPALGGFLAEPLDTARLPAIAAPTLVLTQPGDALHPLRSGEVLNSLMPAAALCVAPSTSFWGNRSEDLANLVTAFIEQRDGVVRQSSTALSCVFVAARHEVRASAADASIA